MLNQFKLLALRFDLAVRCDMSRQAWPGFSSRIHQELKMNKDQVKGATKEAAGKVQEAAGKQVAGRAQKAYGNAKEAVKDAHK
jgi:uncharacterized protein YjbJ (UPF0337 family)